MHKQTIRMREIFKTYEFDTFLKELDSKTVSKFDQVIEVITSIKVIPAKFVKN